MIQMCQMWSQYGGWYQCGLMCWCVDVDVGSGNGSAGGSLFGIYYGYDMVSSDFFFDGFSVGIHMGEYIDE